MTTKVKTRRCLTCRYQRDEFVFPASKPLHHTERYVYCAVKKQRILSATIKCGDYQDGAK